MIKSTFGTFAKAMGDAVGVKEGELIDLNGWGNRLMNKVFGGKSGPTPPAP